MKRIVFSIVAGAAVMMMTACTDKIDLETVDKGCACCQTVSVEPDRLVAGLQEISKENKTLKLRINETSKEVQYNSNTELVNYNGYRPTYIKGFDLSKEDCLIVDYKEAGNDLIATRIKRLRYINELEAIWIQTGNLGDYVENGIEWFSVVASPVFDGITVTIDFLIEGFQGILLWPHPLAMLVFLTLLAYVVMARTEGFFTKEGWKAGRGMVVFTILGMLLLQAMNFWEETMQTFALVIVSALIALAIGIPTGIYASRNDRFEQAVRPILDFMQTMPAFVYLIPAILFFSVGNVPGVVATVVFSLPPGVRFTDLGIRGVQQDVIEASKAFGATPHQLLYKVQIPLAMKTIMGGVNQVIMLALSMVVIASMVGAAGLGQLVYKGILKAEIGLGFEAGLGIVIIAIFLDRITQTFGDTKD